MFPPVFEFTCGGLRFAFIPLIGGTEKSALWVNPPHVSHLNGTDSILRFQLQKLACFSQILENNDFIRMIFGYGLKHMKHYVQKPV